jgi:multidrug efflux pump subunit AcrA (membrane-fusion protein)
VKVRADDPERLLKPGMYAAVTIVTATKTDALLVPANAMTTDAAGAPAVLIVKDGHAALRPVKTGITTAESVEIVEGISRGEQVIVVGQSAVRDGQAVSVREAPATKN